MGRYEELVVDGDFLCYNISSPSSPSHSMMEFAFHMSDTKLSMVPLTSPADELFLDGKLLPLHHLPHLQTVENLFQSSEAPFESCNVSAPASCFVSGELNPEDYLECSSVITQPVSTNKSWSKKLMSMRQTLKLKTSKAYLKSLFMKTQTPNGSSITPKSKESGLIKGLMKMGRRSSMSDGGGGHRRSFSGVAKWPSSSSASSSCSSSDSFSSGQQATLKRSSSVNSELESSINGAIAYCNKSQKSASDVGLSSVSAAKIAAATSQDTVETLSA